jgi:hypothetical protein
MKRFTAVALIAGVVLSGCAKSSEFDSEEAENEGVAKVENDQVILTAQAAQRIGVKTAPATERTIPYAAVFYDENGKAYAFTSPGRLTYVQTPVTVAYVKGGQAVLRRGPKAGTPVVTVGSAELLGTAHGVEEE